MISAVSFWNARRSGCKADIERRESVWTLGLEDFAGTNVRERLVYVYQQRLVRKVRSFANEQVRRETFQRILQVRRRPVSVQNLRLATCHGDSQEDRQEMRGIGKMYGYAGARRRGAT